MEGSTNDKRDGDDGSSVNDDSCDDPDRIWNDPTFRKTQAFHDLPTATTRSTPSTRLVLISDTHGNHEQIYLPPNCDVLIHAGDFTKTGEGGSVSSLAEYFGNAPSEKRFKQVICIAGNHDLVFDHDYYPKHWSRFQRSYNPAVREQKELKSSCTYLQDSSCQLVQLGKTGGEDDDGSDSSGSSLVYGSPWSSRFYDWAFNVNRGHDSDQLYGRIPDDTDVLITHGPPLGRGDQTIRNQRAGCADLLRHVQTRVKPRLHVFGHIHEDAGVISYDGTTVFVNACVVDLHYKVKPNPCIVIDLPHDKSMPAQVVRPNCTLTSNQFEGWLDKNNYNILSGYCKQAAVTDDSNNNNNTDLLLKKLPNGNEWLRQPETVFVNVCDALYLHRDVPAQNELRQALRQIHAESFS